MNLYESIVKESADGKPCVICGKSFTGWGNDPWPIKEEGYCCDKCNMEVVLPARLAMLAKKDKEKAEEVKEESITLEESTKFYNTEDPNDYLELSHLQTIKNSAGKVLDVNTHGLVQNGDTVYVVTSDSDLDTLKVYSVDYQVPYIFKTKGIEESQEIKESDDVRKYSNALIDLCEQGGASWESIARGLIDYCSEDDIKDFCISEDIIDLDNQEEIEDAEESKPKYITDDYPDWIKEKLANEEDVTAWYCPQCNEYFETPVEDGEFPKCPNCGSDDLEKVEISFSDIVDDFQYNHAEDLYNEMCERYPEEVNSDTELDDFGDERILDLIKDLIY